MGGKTMKRKILSLLTSLMLAATLLASLPAHAQQAHDGAWLTHQAEVSVGDIPQTEPSPLYSGDVKELQPEEDDSYVPLSRELYSPVDDSGLGQQDLIKSLGTSYGYNDLGKRSKGSNMQRFYKLLFSYFINIWDQTADHTNKTYESKYSHEKTYIIGHFRYSDYGLTLDEAIDTLAMVRHDNPILYFVSPLIVYNRYYGELIPQMTYEFGTKVKRKELQQKIISYVRGFCNGVNYKYSDYYKAFTVNEYIRKNVEYWYVNGEANNHDYAHCIIGPIVYKKGVCEAYAKLFQLMLNYLGVDNCYVVGLGRRGNHAWNIVKIDGKFYNYDTTWNDVTFNYNQYVARGSDFFNRDHTAYTRSHAGSMLNMYQLPAISELDYYYDPVYRKITANYTKKLSNARQIKADYTSTTLMWKIPYNADGVYVYLYNNSSKKFDVKAKLGHYNNVYTLTGLLAGRSYKVMLRTYYTYKGKLYISDTPNYITVKTASAPTPIISVTRIAGNDRYDTANKIASAAYKTCDTVVIASGENYADALAGVPYAHACSAPILLTSKSSLSSGTRSLIKKLNAKHAIILGGVNAIKPNVTNQLKEDGLSVRRIAGSTRFETASLIASDLYKKTGVSPKDVFFVYSNNYPDALAVSNVAAVKKSPVLYVAGNGVIDSSTRNYIKSLSTKPTTAYIVGGSRVISYKADEQLKKLCTYTFRIAGNDRLETCRLIYTTFDNVLNRTTVCISTGYNYPDALAGGVLAAKNNAPMLLVGKDIDKMQLKMVSSDITKRIYVFGGEKAVPSTLIYKIQENAA